MSSDRSGDRPGYAREQYKVSSAVNADALETVLLGGPRSDVDWMNATVTVKVPINGTAQTTVQEVELPLSHLAGLLAASEFTFVERVVALDEIRDKKGPDPMPNYYRFNGAIQVSFEAPSYEVARSIIRALGGAVSDAAAADQIQDVDIATTVQRDNPTVTTDATRTAPFSVPGEYVIENAAGFVLRLPLSGGELLTFPNESEAVKWLERRHGARGTTGYLIRRRRMND